MLAVFAIVTAWYARKAFTKQSQEAAAIERQVETIPMLPPGTGRFVQVPPGVLAMFGTTQVNDRSCLVSLEFTDASENRWERDPRGALNPIS